MGITNFCKKITTLKKSIFFIITCLFLTSCKNNSDAEKIDLYDVKDINSICNEFILDYYTHGEDSSLKMEDYISSPNLIKYIEYKYKYESNKMVFENLTMNLSKMEWVDNNYAILNVQATIDFYYNGQTSEKHIFLIEIIKNKINILDWFVFGITSYFDDKFRMISVDISNIDEIEIVQEKNRLIMNDKDFWNDDKKVKELFQKIEQENN